MGKHFAAISTCLAIVLNLLTFWAASASGGSDGDGGAMQWEWAPPPPSVGEEKLGEFRVKRDANGYGHIFCF